MATIRKDLPHQIVIQSNTARIMEQMNYEEVEPYLISYFILSFEERRKLITETPQDQKWYIIEKISKGTLETFHSFLKVLEESQDTANHELMIHLQQVHRKTGQSTPLCLSEMLNTLSNSMNDELVLDTPIQSPVWKCSKLKTPPMHASTHTSCSGLPDQRKTEQMESSSTASPTLPTKSPTPLSPCISTPLDSQDKWVFVHIHADITYHKNLAVVMEYVCNEMAESLTNTSLVEVHENISASIKLVKAVYSAADPKTATPETRAADEQLQCLYKQLMKILQGTRHSGIIIDLDPILERIGYSTDNSVLTECSMEQLIVAVEKLNQNTRPSVCVIV